MALLQPEPQQPAIDPQAIKQEAEPLEDATPEEQEIYDTVVAETVKAVMADGMISKVIRRMTKGNPAEVAAKTAVGAVKTFIAAMGGTVDPEIAINAAVEVATQIHEVAIEGGLMKNDANTAQMLLGMVVAEAEKEFGNGE